MCEVKETSHTPHKHCMIHLREVPRVVKLTETEVRMVVSEGAGRGGDGELLFNGAELQFGKMKNFWRQMVVMVV